MDNTEFTPNPVKNKHLTLTERIKIELMLKDGKTSYSLFKAAERLINTILNEIKQDITTQIKSGTTFSVYLGVPGQARYKEIENPAAESIRSWSAII